MNAIVPKPITDWAAFIEGERTSARQEGYDAGYKDGQADGLAEGYQKGLDDASATVAEAIASKRAESAPAESRHHERAQLIESIQWSPDDTNRDRILRAVRAQPGMRPVEIIKWLQDHGANPNENSILTTIKRMRNIDIFKHGNGWYPTKRSEEAA